MIHDRLEKADRYHSLHLDFAHALDFLRGRPLESLPLERIEIAGQSVYAMVSKPKSRSRAEAPLEAHRKYIDIQYLISGVEEIGWKSRTRCRQQKEAYDATKDVEFFSDAPDSFATLHPGDFVIFFPDDAHAPLIGTGDLHKIVIKVMV